VGPLPVIIGHAIFPFCWSVPIGVYICMYVGVYVVEAEKHMCVLCIMLLLECYLPVLLECAHRCVYMYVCRCVCGAGLNTHVCIMYPVIIGHVIFPFCWSVPIGVYANAYSHVCVSVADEYGVVVHTYTHAYMHTYIHSA
jgi:hypothetical protein